MAGAEFKLTDAIDDSIVRKLKQISEQSEKTSDSYAKLVEQLSQMQRFNPKGLEELQEKAAKYNETANQLRETQTKLNELQKQQSELYKKVAKDIEAQVKAQSQKAKLEGQLLANEQKRLRNQQLAEKQNRSAAASEEDITRALNEQAKTMRQASEQNRILRQAMRDTDLTAADSAQKMEAYNRKIMENEELLDKNSDAMIQRKRNIGNYASAWNGLGVSVQQVARELPSLTMGINTFFLAISNNLPMLVDELKRASERVKELKEAGEEAEPVWKQLTKSILSWQTLLLVGITVLSMYGEEILEWGKNLFKGKENAEDLEAAQKKINASFKESGTGVGEQVAKVKQLSERWKELGGDLESKKKFIVENKTAFNELGVEVTTVKDAENLLVTNTEAFIQSMVQRAQAAAGLKLASEQYEKALQKQIEIEEAMKEGVTSGDKFKAGIANFGLQQAGSTDRVSDTDIYEERISAMKQEKKEIESLAFSYIDLSIAKDKDSKKTLENANIQLTQGSQGTQAAEDAAQKRMEIEKALRDSRIALINNEEKRELAALRAAFDDKIAEIEGQSEEEKELRANLEAQYNNEVLKIQAEFDKKRSDEESRQAKEREKQRKEEVENELSVIENAYASKAVESTSKVQQGLKEASELYAKGLLTQEEYERRKYEITKDYGLEQAKLVLDMLKEQLENEKLTAEEREKIKQKIANAELALNDEIIASNEEAAERTREEWEKISGIFADFASQADDMVQGLGSVFQGIFDIFKEIADGGKISVENVLQSISAIAQGVSEVVSGMYDAQIEELEKQEEANEETKEKELARIEELAEKGAISEEEAEARKRVAEDKTAKKNEEIARKKAALQTKQAKLEKAANIISTIMNTAVAVMKAWSQGGIFAAPMAAMIAAMGAVQLATIVAQPIPKYAKGTKGHKGGLAWVGDGGVSETIITNKGAFLTPDTPTLVDLPKGAKVIPYALDMEAMKAMAPNPNLYYSKEEKTPININNDYSGLQKDIRELKESQKRSMTQIAKLMKQQDYKRFSASI